MTRILRTIALAVTLTLTAGAFSACNDDDDSDNSLQFSAIQIEPSQITIFPGNSRTLKVYSDPRGYEIHEARWSTTDASIATVDQQGNVTALTPGTTTVIAEFHDMTAACKVNVSDPSPKPVE